MLNHNGMISSPASPPKIKNFLHMGLCIGSVILVLFHCLNKCNHFLFVWSLIPSLFKINRQYDMVSTFWSKLILKTAEIYLVRLNLEIKNPFLLLLIMTVSLLIDNIFHYILFRVTGKKLLNINDSENLQYFQHIKAISF